MKTNSLKWGKLKQLFLRNTDIPNLLPVSFMREILSSLRSSYTRVPATSRRSFKRWESGAVAIWLIWMKHEDNA